MAHSGIREGLKLLSRRDFAKMFIAYFISFFGTAMAPIAIVFAVLELTGSTKDSAIVIAAPTTAQILILLLGGALADRTSRQRMLVGADLLAMCSQMTIALLFLSGYATLPLLTALMLINGVAYGLNIPAATGFIPQIVSKEELHAANALLGVSRNGALMLGAATAGVLVATLGAGFTLAIDAISFGISAILIATLNPRQQVRPEKATLFEDLRLGWREFTSHRWLWVIVLQFTLVVAALDGVFGLLGPAITQLKMTGPIDWGIISAGFGMGTLCGGLVALKLHVKRPMLFGTFCVFFFSVLPLTLAVPFSVWVIAAGAFTGGVAGQMFAVLWYTTLQRQIPPHLLSRVSAYDHLGSIALAPLGIVVAGYLFEIIGARETLLIAAATVIIPTLCVLAVREVRELRTDDVGFLSDPSGPGG